MPASAEELSTNVCFLNKNDIYILLATSMTYAIDTVNFNSNEAHIGSGGAIYSSQYGAVMNISNCGILNNNASTYGGALYSVNGQINILSTDFLSNTGSQGRQAFYASEAKYI